METSVKKKDPRQKMYGRRDLLKGIALAGLGAGVAGVLSGMKISEAAIDTTKPAIVSQFSQIGDVSIVIFQDSNGTVYAIDKTGVTGQIGKIIASGTDAASVIQQAINAFPNPISNPAVGPLIALAPTENLFYNCYSTIQANKTFSIIGPTRNRAILQMKTPGIPLFNINPPTGNYILEFRNIKIAGSGGSGSIGVKVTNVSEVIFVGCEVRDFETGVMLNNPGTYNTFINSWLLNGTYGLYVNNATEIQLLNSYLRNIQYFSGTLGRVLISGNTMGNFGLLRFATVPRNLSIINNIFEWTDTIGAGRIHIELQDQANPVTSQINIKNNIFSNISNQPASSMYAIKVGANINTAIIEQNIFNNVTQITGTGSYKIKRNFGYLTENSGTAVISAGSTCVTVNHGLIQAPTKVLVTPTANVKVWVTNITATQFTINIDTAQTADTTVYWYAEV